MTQISLNSAGSERLNSTQRPVLGFSLQELVALALLSKASKALGSSAKEAQSSSNQDDLSPVLRALMDEIETNGKISALTQQMVESILKYANSQASVVISLAEHLQELQRELAGNISADQAKALEQQIKSLEELYEQALQNLSKDTDPADQKKDKEQIAQALAGMRALASKYPQFKQFQSLLKLMENQKDITASVSNFAGAINSIIEQDNALTGEIEMLTNKLSAALNNVIPGIKDSKDMAKNLSDKQTMQTIVKFVEELERQLSQANLSAHDKVLKVQEFKDKVKHFAQYAEFLSEKEQGLPLESNISST